MDCGHNATDVRSQQHFGFVVVADDGFCTALLRALACGESVGASQTQGGDGPRGQKVSSNGTKGCHYVVGSCAGTNPKGCHCQKEDEQRGDRVHPALQVPAGGSPGKDWILRELTENKLAANAGVKEIPNTLRTREEEPGKGIRIWGSTTRSTAADGPAVKMVRLSMQSRGITNGFSSGGHATGIGP